MLSHQKLQPDVRNGNVGLAGQVDWNDQRELIEEHVGRIIGVKFVTSPITVTPQVCWEIFKIMREDGTHVRNMQK